MPEHRTTLPTLTVLGVFTEQDGQPLYGYDLMRRADLKSGTLYPILARLERQGYLDSQWEDVDPTREGRPARRVYRLTKAGRGFAEAELAKARRVLGGGLSHA